MDGLSKETATQISRLVRDAIRNEDLRKFQRNHQELGWFATRTSESAKKVLTTPLPSDDVIRIAMIAAIGNEISINNVAGSIAELGVFRGVTASYIRRAIPDRPFYLFDTFEGFDKQQAKNDVENYKTVLGDFSNTSVEFVLNRVGRSNCIIKKGLFPETAKDIEDKFAFVSLDVDLYQPTKDGLEYFHPRLSSGGYIMVHDCLPGAKNYRGCRQAVLEYCKEKSIPYVPMADICGSIIIPK